jgi:IclR family transcriptional regulator, KDG regulon repressor
LGRGLLWRVPREEDAIGGADRQQRKERMDEVTSRSYLKVVAKTLRVMEVMASLGHEVRLTELARALKFPKATTFRILFTLGQLGYVEQDAGTGTYRLSEKADWSRRDQFRDSLKGIARPYMERLLSRFEQTVNLGVLDQDQVLYIDILEGLRSIRMAATVNTYGPLHCTALGKSILAYLPPDECLGILKRRPLARFTANTITLAPQLMHHLSKVRSRGYAVDNEEAERGARCVAVPIFNSENQPAAGMSVSGPTSHIQRSTAREIADVLINYGARISERMGSNSGKGYYEAEAKLA